MAVAFITFFLASPSAGRCSRAAFSSRPPSPIRLSANDDDGRRGCRAATTKVLLRMSLAADEFKDGSLTVSRTCSTDNDEGSVRSETHLLRYRVCRPMRLSSAQAAPVVVLHGGPGVPSDYLYPLRDVLPYRSVVFYDQLGCGRSPGPGDAGAYSIETSLDDLDALLKKLSLRRYHLYGQSFGGILAHEHMKREAERRGAGASDFEEDGGCLSAVLSSTPTGVKLVESVASGLLETLKAEDSDESTLGERFRVRHQCRTEHSPKPLTDAYAHAGTVWRGTHSIPDWEASPPSERAARMPSAMVMRGEHDFVSHECVERWKDSFNHPYVRERVIDGCAHHGLLEDGKAYGELVDSFFSEYD